MLIDEEALSVSQYEVALVNKSMHPDCKKVFEVGRLRRISFKIMRIHSVFSKQQNLCLHSGHLKRMNFYISSNKSSITPAPAYKSMQTLRSTESCALQTFRLLEKVSSPDAYAIPIQVRQKNVKSVFISRSPVQNSRSLSGVGVDAGGNCGKVD